jgi:hypothetical protein
VAVAAQAQEAQMAPEPMEHQPGAEFSIRLEIQVVTNSAWLLLLLLLLRSEQVQH